MKLTILDNADGARARLFVGLTLLVLIVGAGWLFTLPQDAAIWLHVRAGYYFSLAAFLALAWFICASVRRAHLLEYFKAHRWGLILALAGGLSLQFFQQPGIRIAEGEPAQQLVAQSMHEWRQVSKPEVGYYLEGQTADGTQRLIGEGMSFYPFLVSLAHDLTGFRVANGRVVNAGLGVVFFLFIYMIGARLYPLGGGVFMVLLAAGLPLLDGVAAGYGDELSQLVFLALLFLASLQYVARPEAKELGLFCAAGCVLALNREESVFYLFYIAVVMGAMLLTRRGRIECGWFPALAPLFLIPIFTARAIFQMFHPASEGSGVALAAPESIIRLGAWLFNFSAAEASFPLLSFFGVIGLITLSTTLLVSLLQKRAVAPHTWLVLGFAGVVLAQYLFKVEGHFSNRWEADPGQSLLPLHLLFLILAAWWLLGLKVSTVFTRRLLLAVGALVFVIGLPARMASPRGEAAAVNQHAGWALDWMAANDDRQTLYATPLNELFLLNDYATVSWRLVDPSIRQLMQLVREGYYDQVVGFVIERLDVTTDRWLPVGAAQPLPKRILVREVEQRRYAYNTRARFFVIEGFVDTEGAEIRPRDLELLKYGNYDSLEDYVQQMQSLHPRYRLEP
jgi:hypothetical protein